MQVGLDGIAFASSQGGIMLNLSPKTVYEALAASPYGREQTAKTWADVDPALPADPILVYGPPSTSGTRDALKELVLEVGCASNPDMATLKQNDENRYKQACTEVRDDGGYVDQGEQDNLIVQKIESNPRAVGIFGFSYLDENSDKVQGLPMNGVQPTYDNIAQLRLSRRAAALCLCPRKRICARFRVSAPTWTNGPRAGTRMARWPASAWSRWRPKPWRRMPARCASRSSSPARNWPANNPPIAAVRAAG